MKHTIDTTAKQEAGLVSLTDKYNASQNNPRSPSSTVQRWGRRHSIEYDL